MTYRVVKIEPCASRWPCPDYWNAEHAETCGHACNGDGTRTVDVTEVEQHQLVDVDGYIYDDKFMWVEVEP